MTESCVLCVALHAYSRYIIARLCFAKGHETNFWMTCPDSKKSHMFHTQVQKTPSIQIFWRLILSETNIAPGKSGFEWLKAQGTSIPPANPSFHPGMKGTMLSGELWRHLVGGKQIWWISKVTALERCWPFVLYFYLYTQAVSIWLFDAF